MTCAKRVLPAYRAISRDIHPGTIADKPYRVQVDTIPKIVETSTT